MKSSHGQYNIVSLLTEANPVSNNSSEQDIY